MSNLKNKPLEYWKSKLNDEQFRITRLKGTEYPFTGKLLKNTEKGVYLCVNCGEELFSSETKYDAHCGWPSFYDAISQNKIELKEDTSHGMIRTEVLCSNCGAHLGHVFDVGSETQTGKWYCINSVSLDFKKQSDNTSKD